MNEANERWGRADLSLRLDGEPGDSRRCRRAAEHQLNGHIAPELLDDVLLVISELVANGVIHGISPLAFHLSFSDGTITVSVEDRGGGDLAAGAPQPEEARGRGLVIVDQLADHWGVTPTPEGKSVWATMSGWSSPGAWR